MRAAHIGCAGWSLARAAQPLFDAGASQLQRYATRFNATEINSSFYRPHRRGTYERWAASVPPDFRFAVKLPRAISHEKRLAGCGDLLADFLAQAGGLGERLGSLLLQLPPSLAFHPVVAPAFLHELRRQHQGAVALEPRHASWFTAEVDALLRETQIARVLADPVLHAAGRDPGGWQQLVYLRLHGSPRVYYSDYSQEVLQALAQRIGLALREGRGVWCICDNPAAGAATHNGLALAAALNKDPP